MEERREKSIEVQVSKDGLEAYIKLCPGEGETYTVEQLVEALGAKKVVYGIDHIELQNIIKEKRYFEEVLVAKGTLPEDGKDGYYEFLFETDVENYALLENRIYAYGSQIKETDYLHRDIFIWLVAFLNLVIK